MTGLALIIPQAVQTNQRARVDSEATMLAQSEMEQMLARPLTATTFTDTAGNTVSIAAGGAPLANGVIDYSQAAVTNYRAFLTSSTGGRYDVRWNVQTLSDGTKQFIVSGQSSSQRFLMPPVNLMTRIGR